MKKALLSGSVVLAFILYGFHQRNEDSQVHVVVPNLAIQSATPTSAPTITPAPTETPSASTDTPTPTSTPTPTPTPAPTPQGKYKNGTYTGSAANAYYGYIQVKAIISGGKITDVQFLQYPNDRSTSRMINSEAMPALTQEAIQAQSANVDGVSGASDTSQAFIESLTDALNQAAN